MKENKAKKAFLSTGGGPMTGINSLDCWLICYSDLKTFITPEVAKSVQFLLEQLQLPEPTASSQILYGTDGRILFLNPYAMVLRFEVADHLATFERQRVNNSRHALKPIKAWRFGNLIVELCPGITSEKVRDHDVEKLTTRLSEDGYLFHDKGHRNVGYLPAFSPDAPEGLPIALDRFVCKPLHSINNKLRSLMPRFCPQDILYEELIEKINAAWPDVTKPADAALIRDFWGTCAKYKAQGKLVSGWNACSHSMGSVANDAAHSAYQYDKTLRKTWHVAHMTAEANIPEKPETTFGMIRPI